MTERPICVAITNSLARCPKPADTEKSVPPFCAHHYYLAEMIETIVWK